MTKEKLEKEAKEFVSEKVDKGNFDIEQKAEQFLKEE